MGTSTYSNFYMGTSTYSNFCMGNLTKRSTHLKFHMSNSSKVSTCLNHYVLLKNCLLQEFIIHVAMLKLHLVCEN